MKRCDRCGMTKPLRSFHRHNRTADGLFAQCKVCRSQAQGFRRSRSLGLEPQVSDEEFARLMAEGWTATKPSEWKHIPPGKRDTETAFTAWYLAGVGYVWSTGGNVTGQKVRWWNARGVELDRSSRRGLRFDTLRGEFDHVSDAMDALLSPARAA